MKQKRITKEIKNTIEYLLYKQIKQMLNYGVQKKSRPQLKAN